MSEQMREEFEAWVASLYPNQSLQRFQPLHGVTEGEYMGFTVQHCWMAWKASRESRPSAYTAVDMTTAAAQGFRDGIDKLNAAYRAGWDASGEGWNGEYPSDAHEHADWPKERDLAIKAIIAADVSKEG